MNLDSAMDRRLAKEDPRLFLEKYKAPLIIDEFQRAPELLLALKEKVDKEKNLKNCSKIKGTEDLISGFCKI